MIVYETALTATSAQPAAKAGWWCAGANHYRPFTAYPIQRQRAPAKFATEKKKLRRFGIIEAVCQREG